ncbi:MULTISPECIES: CPBP family intramembrane glutamic endopeptidase, partial [unclassified Mammaliicoccus]|uniref:CPBP family intramembrane glutamic endopeptidase n=1 Tax=unclassified Mammaliicoccus TaxID=2803851 RepID=UPI001EFA8761
MPIFISIIIFVILGPIFEELIFRGFILKGMFKGHLLAGFIVSSILFGGPSTLNWTTSLKRSIVKIKKVGGLFMRRER